MAMTDDEKNTKKRNVKLFETFTKSWVTILLIFAIVDLQLTYVLAFLGKDQIAETLSVAVVTEIIGVTLGYIARAYFDTATESKHQIEREKHGLQTSESDEVEPDVETEDDEDGCEG